MKSLGSRRKESIHQQILKTLYLLRIIISNTRLYSIEHPKTQEMISKAFTSLNKTLRVLPELSILIIDNDLIINNKAIRTEEADYFSLFITVLKQKNISHIAFRRGITPRELSRFLSDLAAPSVKTVYSGSGISCGQLTFKEDPHNDQLLQANQLHSIKTQGKPGEKQHALTAKLRSLSTRQLLMAQELYFSIRKEQGFDLRGVQENMSSFVNHFSQNLNPLSILTNLKSSDEYTFTHVINVCILTLAQAESLGFRDQHLYKIGITATLYDIGKTFIPEELLNKPGKLDKKEQQIIRNHSMKGAKYLLGLEEAPKLAALAALEHHIHFDGTGYPDIGTTWQTNIVSQMIAIADTFDAMRCSRPYSRASSKKIIFDMLSKEKGKNFNPLLVDNFLTILSRTQKKQV